MLFLQDGADAFIKKEHRSVDKQPRYNLQTFELLE